MRGMRPCVCCSRFSGAFRCRHFFVCLKRQMMREIAKMELSFFRAPNHVNGERKMDQDLKTLEFDKVEFKVIPKNIEFLIM